MAKHVDPQTGLTPAQEAYCVHRANGFDKVNSYTQSHSIKGVSQKAIAQRANRLDNNVDVIERVRVLVSEKNLGDCLSVGAALTALLKDMEGAREAQNWTALSSFHRLCLQCLGLLKENLILTEEQRMPDEELIKRVAGGNTALGRELSLALGSKDAFRERDDLPVE